MGTRTAFQAYGQNQVMTGDMSPDSAMIRSQTDYRKVQARRCAPIHLIHRHFQAYHRFSESHWIVSGSEKPQSTLAIVAPSQHRIRTLNDQATILAIGDVHLGTSCSGMPDVVSSMGIDAAELTPASALSLSVDLAIKEQVSAVVFAGDVVESTNARFEALPPLE